MEAKEEGRPKQEQPKAEHAEEPPKTPPTEVSEEKTSPPANGGGKGGGGQQPSQEVPPRIPWYARFSLTDWITAIAAAVSALATVAIMIWAGLQWKEMDDAGKQTDRLICLYGQQVAQLSKQASDTHDLAVNAKLQADRTKAIADQAAPQARAARDAANAAQQALYLSNRANIISIQPQLRIADTRQVLIPFINTGHLAATDFSVEIYEITTNGINNTPPIEAHWTKIGKIKIDPATFGSDFVANIGLPGVVPEDLKNVKQAVVYAAAAVYLDGFPKTVAQHYLVCAHTFVNAKNHEISWIPCDPATIIPELKHAMKYPEHYEKQNR